MKSENLIKGIWALFRTLRFITRLFRSAIFLFILATALGIGLVKTSLSLAALTAQVATLTANAATSATTYKKQMAKAVSKEKAKARLKRLMVAVPVIGTGAAVAFEANAMNNWLEENPSKTSSDYGCKVASSSVEVMDDVLAELPKRVRPSKDFLISKMPKCDKLVTEE